MPCHKFCLLPAAEVVLASLDRVDLAAEPLAAWLGLAAEVDAKPELRL